jgi:hypothetical protein
MKVSDIKIGLRVGYGYEQGKITSISQNKIVVQFVGRDKPQTYKKSQVSELQNLDLFLAISDYPSQPEPLPV